MKKTRRQRKRKCLPTIIKETATVVKIYWPWTKKFKTYKLVDKDKLADVWDTGNGWPLSGHKYFNPECRICRGFGAVYGYSKDMQLGYNDCPNCNGNGFADFLCKY